MGIIQFQSETSAFQLGLRGRKYRVMQKFFKNNIVVAIITAIILDLFIYEAIWQIINTFRFSFGTSNAAFFVREIITKVLPAFFIAFFIGTTDSLKNPFKHLGNSLLSGALIFVISIMGTIVTITNTIKDSGRFKSAIDIIFFVCFVLMVGLSEELFIRGTLTRLIVDRLGGEGKGAVLSVILGALLFGLYHLPNYLGNGNLNATLLQVLANIMFGLLMCAVYVKWKNLLGMVILHAALDFMTLSQYALIDGRSIADRPAGTEGNLRQTIVSNSVFVIAAIVVIIHKKKPETNFENK